MRKNLLLLFLFSASTSGFAQLNMTLLSNIQYEQNLCDVWGWVDPATGAEYAIVGLYDGVSIISVTDPDNPREVIRIPGPESDWRDIKTWKHYAYVTNESGGGILIIDLSLLPDSAPHFEWKPIMPGTGTPILTSHNIYIDEFGTCYLAGNTGSGGVIYLDMATDPTKPKVVGFGPPEYAHDTHAKNNLLYSCELYRGQFAVYDVSDKSEPLLLARQNTPFFFTHSAWLSEDGNILFTADERGNAPITSYDISDLDDIQKLDEFRPIYSLNKDVIPHNVHVWQDWLILSYYTDGAIIVDASDPANLIEVGNYDTFIGEDGGFHGAWGAYPFLPSGNILVSDIENGLFVLAPNYVRACRLQGAVTDESTGSLLSGVKITINSIQENLAFTDFNGRYTTGQAIPGTFEVTFSKTGYESRIVNATLHNGIVTNLDVTLQPKPSITISGMVVSISDNLPILDARIILSTDGFSLEVATNSDGFFEIPNVFPGSFEVHAGAWGYHQAAQTLSFTENSDIVFRLEPGYYDDFTFEWSWTKDVSAVSGSWIKGRPQDQEFEEKEISPEFDIPSDFGEECYLSGNLSGGFISLSSPPLDLSLYERPFLKFNFWFLNLGFIANTNDRLEVKITNTLDTVSLFNISSNTSEWEPLAIDLTGKIDLTRPVNIIFEAVQSHTTVHFLSSAIDSFEITDGSPVNIAETDEKIELKITPNPFTGSFTLEIDENDIDKLRNSEVTILNNLGKVFEKTSINGQNVIPHLGSNLSPGHYFIRVTRAGRSIYTSKLVKQ